MMRKVSMISVLAAFMAQARARDNTKDAQDSYDKLVDKLFDRTLGASPLPDAGLDDTTIGKTHQGAHTPRIRASPVNLAGVAGIGNPGIQQRTLHVAPRWPQRSVMLRALQTGTKPREPLSENSASTGEAIDKMFPGGIDSTLPKSPMIGLTKMPEVTAVFETEITLEPSVAAAIRWMKARSTEGRPVMVVSGVPEDSEAYRSGIRPGMVVKTLIGGSGRTEDERQEMSKLRAINLRNFKDSIRLARYPITFAMLEGVKLGDESTISNEDRRIAAAYARRKEIEEIDEKRMGEEGRDFPVVGLLVGATFLPPFVILALNAYFGWFVGY
jgi:hypothetical protein